MQLINSRAERIVRVSDDQIIDAAAAMLSMTHNLVEFAGAAAFAALTKERREMRGKAVAVIASGGNLDTSFLPLVRKRLQEDRPA